MLTKRYVVTENIEFSVSIHGNSRDKKPFYVIKKSTISSCKIQLSGSSSKRSISVLYKIHQDKGEMAILEIDQDLKNNFSIYVAHNLQIMKLRISLPIMKN